MSGMNRAQRRSQQRERLREWNKTGQMEQIMMLQKNGITRADIDKEHDKAYKEGYREGYLYASEVFMKKMYAAVAKELLENENSSEDIAEFVKNLDHRFAVMIDADEEIDDVYNLIGIRFIVDKNSIRRVE